jgi:hypothetical protein
MDAESYTKGYKKGFSDGMRESLFKIQEKNTNNELPSNDTLYKIFSILFEAKRKMDETHSCYMNVYEYYADEIVKHWNDETENKV